MAQQATRHGGPIDPFSPLSLHDLVDEETVRDLDPRDGDAHFEFYGIHLLAQPGSTRILAQLDGHTGTVGEFDARDYDDVLELVDDLMDIKILWSEHDWQRARNDGEYPNEELVEWAGRLMTSDPEKAEEEPELYAYVPDEPEPERQTEG